MSNKLEQLRKLTTVVADTGEIDAIKKYQPEDATTNPSLILKAAQIEEYAPLIDASIEYAKAQSNDKAQQVQDTCDMLAVNIGKEILKTIPGRISTEVDARLSYDMEGSVAKARQLVKMYTPSESKATYIVTGLSLDQSSTEDFGALSSSAYPLIYRTKSALTGLM